MDLMRAEQHNAVAFTRGRGELPNAFVIQANHGGEPAGTVQVLPLLRHAQMTLENTATDRLEIHDPRESFQMIAYPVAQIAFEYRVGGSANGPIIKRTLQLAGHAFRMAPPTRHAACQRHVGRHMSAREKRHPQVSRLNRRQIFRFVMNDMPTGSHAPDVVNGLGEYGVSGWQRPVRAMLQALGLAN